ncbi:unnamed protein product [Rhizophagus irregularis]|nr:unnamed protein product [Rhizophagus irregularis]
MSIKKQYEYQTVKITVKLGDRFDRSFQNGQFGIIVIGVFIRWYDGKSRVKGRRERDKWQLWMDVSEIERKAREQMMNRNTLKPLCFSGSGRYTAEKGNGKNFISDVQRPP